MRRQALSVVEGIVGLQAGFGAGRGRVKICWIWPAVSATLQIRTSAIWPTKPYQPPGVVGQVVCISGPDLVEGSAEIRKCSREGAHGPAIEVKRCGVGRAIENGRDGVPMTIVDRYIRVDLVHIIADIQSALEFAVGADVEGEHPSGRLNY